MAKTWIFDFDGTLVNSRPLIKKCFKEVTKKIAPERLSYLENILIGPPLKETATNILGPDHSDKVDVFAANFIELHDKNVTNCKPYVNASETLITLRRLGHILAIATNKRMAPTLILIKHLGWESLFKTIECSDSEKSVRDKAKMIDDIIQKHPQFTDTIFVGDTIGDASAVEGKKIKFIKANYGYGTKEEWKKAKIYKKINNIIEIIRV